MGDCERTEDVGKEADDDGGEVEVRVGTLAGLVALGGDAGGVVDVDVAISAAVGRADVIVVCAVTFPVVPVALAVVSSAVVLAASSSEMGTISVSAVIRSYLVTNFVKRRHKLVSLYTQDFNNHRLPVVMEMENQI